MNAEPDMEETVRYARTDGSEDDDESQFHLCNVALDTTLSEQNTRN